MQTIIAALISAAVTLIVSLLNTNHNHEKLMAELEKRDALQIYRIEQLEKKQDLHNHVIERTYELKEDVELLKAEDKRHNERIKILEGKAT